MQPVIFCYGNLSRLKQIAQENWLWDPTFLVRRAIFPKSELVCWHGNVYFLLLLSWQLQLLREQDRTPFLTCRNMLGWQGHLSMLTHALRVVNHVVCSGLKGLMGHRTCSAKTGRVLGKLEPVNYLKRIKHHLLQDPWSVTMGHLSTGH